MRIKLLTLGALLAFAVSGFAADPVTNGIYRLSSGRNPQKVMTVNSAGKLVCAAKDASSLGQVWILQKIGTGSNGTAYTLRNAQTALYVQTEGSVGTNYATSTTMTSLYVREHPSLSGYFNISNEDKFSGHICLHEDAASNVVPWSPTTGSTAGGSEWKLEEVTEFTAQQVRDSVIARSPYSTIENGKIYRIISPIYGVAMTESSSDNTVTTAARDDDYSQYWKAVKYGSGYKFQNIYTSRYINKQGGTVSKQYSTVATTYSAFTVKESSNFPYDIVYNIVDASNVCLHCASSQGYSVVGWYASNRASTWQLEPVSLTQEEITKAHAQYTEQKKVIANLSNLRLKLTNFFDDYACTQLKANYAALSDDSLRTVMAEMPEEIQEMAVKIKNNSWAQWEREFREARYGAYSRPEYWGNKLQMSYYGRQNNPTGITGDRNQMLYVFVGQNAPSGASLSIETQSTTGVQATYSKTLTRGLNLVVIPEKNSQLYVSYTTTDGDDIADYDSLDIHIEGGRVNGYFNTTTHDDADWKSMREAGLFAGPVIDVKGAYVMMHMNSQLFQQCVGDSLQRIMRVWDGIVHDELDLMGLLHSDKYPDIYEDIYPRKMNNLMECVSIDYSYMFSTNYLTAYNESTLSTILDYSQMGSGSGALWGPCHEIGHSNQGAIKIVGSTEISNNLFPNALIYQAGNYTSRGWNVQDVQPMLADTLSWPEMYNQGNVLCLTRLFFSLYLYYHALGHDPVFYQKVFRQLRQDPLQHPGQPSITYGKNDYLKFARVVSKIAGADLTDFFEYWGFFRPANDVAVSDYANYTVRTTQADIDETKAYIKACGPAAPQLIFIEDRIRRVKKADGTYKLSLGESPYADCKSEMGQYEDYPRNLEPSGYLYSVNASGAVTVLSSAKNAVGMMVYDKDGRLVYVADTHKFTLPSYVATEGGYTIYCVRADGSLTRMYNRRTETYYTMTVYRGSKDAYVHYTNGTDDGTIPELSDNDIAVVKEAAAPAALTQMRNVVDASGNAQSVELTDTVPFYSPRDFTAAKFSFHSHLSSPLTNRAYPFALDAGSLFSVGKVQIVKGVAYEDDKAYIDLADTTGILPAGYPLFVALASGDSAVWTYSGENVAVIGSGAAFTPVSEMTFTSSFINSTYSGTFYQSSADCKTFDMQYGNGLPLRPFESWMRTSSSEAARHYIVRSDALTGISGVKVNAGKITPAIYTVDGLRVTKPERGRLYIIGGKKQIYR